MQISRDLKLGDHGVIRSPLRNGHEDGNGRNPHRFQPWKIPKSTKCPSSVHMQQPVRALLLPAVGLAAAAGLYLASRRRRASKLRPKLRPKPPPDVDPAAVDSTPKRVQAYAALKPVSAAPNPRPVLGPPPFPSVALGRAQVAPQPEPRPFLRLVSLSSPCASPPSLAA